jgi:hypothetical protein
MMEFKLKPVTDTSWILHQNGVRLAMIIANNKGYNAIGKLTTKHFENLADMCNILGGKVIFEESEAQAEKEVGNVHGFPIKHNTSHDLALDRYPSYAKTKCSNNRFAAGYYSILFSHGWVQSYCPKISTLDDNEWIGPFYTKLEMLSAISAKKKEIKI